MSFFTDAYTTTRPSRIRIATRRKRVVSPFVHLVIVVVRNYMSDFADSLTATFAEEDLITNVDVLGVAHKLEHHLRPLTCR